MPNALTTPLPPNPSLAAILLVVASRAGPRLVFHYPPTPSPDQSSSLSSTHPNWYNSSHAEDDDSDDSSQLSSSSGVAADGSSSEEEHYGSDYGAGSSSRSSTGRTSSRTGSRHDGSSSMRSASRSMWSNIARESLDDPLDSLRADAAGVSGDKGKGSGADPSGHKNEKAKEEPRREWEVLLGYDAESLAKLLNPSVDFGKKRFEVGIDGLCFLGAPKFERSEGRWMKKKKMRRRKGKFSPLKENADEESEDADGLTTLATASDNEDDDLDMPASGIATPASRVPYFESGYGHGQMSSAASEAGSDAKSTSTNDDHDMSMFNVIFVINPPALEYQHRVEEMYDNVVKKFSKALKWEQARSNYVWKESKKILDIKAKAKENRQPTFTLWPNILSSSPLAKSIAVLYDCISHSKIAHIYFSDTLDVSFQIPQAVSTPFVPTTAEPQMPGLWLTTTTCYTDDDDGIDSDVSRHSALLLHENVDSLLKAIEADAHKELSSQLAQFIRVINPTMSLQQIAQHHSVSIRDVTILAKHLIYWRKARAIPPLHHRDTYIVSPNADTSSLGVASEAYAKRFPSLPSLPRMLSILSEAPRQYRTIMPSKDHRNAYMTILAWLVRGGWVTQLRTYAWVCVPAEVKAAVATKIEMERKAAAEADRQSSTDSSIEGAGQTEEDPTEFEEANGSSSSSHSRTMSQDSDATLFAAPLATTATLSPRMATYRSPSRAGSDTGSTSSGRTAVPLLSLGQSPPANLPHKPSPLHVTQSASSLGLDSPPQAMSPSLFSSSIIRSPQKATALESRWIEQIGDMFGEEGIDETEKVRKDREELAESWPVMLKYLDGRHALDDVAGREGWKRNKVLGVVSRLVEAGVMVTVRHW